VNPRITFVNQLNPQIPFVNQLVRSYLQGVVRIHAELDECCMILATVSGFATVQCSQVSVSRLVPSNEKGIHIFVK